MMEEEDLSEEQFEHISNNNNNNNNEKKNEEDSTTQNQRRKSNETTQSNSRKSTTQTEDTGFFDWLPSFSDIADSLGSAVSNIEKFFVTEENSQNPQNPPNPPDEELLRVRRREDRRKREKRRENEENLERNLEQTHTQKPAEIRRPRRSHSENIQIQQSPTNPEIPERLPEEIYSHTSSGNFGRLSVSMSYSPRPTNRTRQSPVQKSRYSLGRASQPPVPRRTHHHQRRNHQAPRTLQPEEERRAQAEEEERLSMQLIQQLASAGEIDIPQFHRRDDYSASMPDRLSNSEQRVIPERTGYFAREYPVTEEERVFRELLQGFLMRRRFRDNDLTYESLLNLQDVQNAAKNKDLMPVYKWEKENNKNSDNDVSEEDKCSVCLGEYEKGESLKTLPCFHKFHVDCIDPWLDTHNTCPVCKYKIDD